MFSPFHEKFGWVKYDDPEFRRALNTLLNTDENMCIMGSAGCGKSTLIKIAYDLFPQYSKLVIASTGVAAANLSQEGIPATTIHSAMQIAPRDWFNSDRPKSTSIKIAEKSDIIFLDEVSMTNANLMDYVLEAIKKGNRKRKSVGKNPSRVIISGDVLQLPPVIKRDSDVFSFFEKEYGDKFFFYRAHNFTDFFFEKSIFNLYHSYRQGEESQKDFVKALDEMRVGTISDESLALLNEHVIPLEDFAKTHDDFLYAVSTNRVCDSMNKKYEEKFVGRPCRTYTASYERLNASSFPTVPQQVTIYEGMRVMTLANDKDHNYNNGSFGRCVGFDEEGYPVVTFTNGKTASVKPFTWSNYYYRVEGDMVKPELAGTCEQVAIRPSFATTYHKAQGRTLENIYLNVGGWQAPSSIYIGVSRIRNINGLGLNRPLKRSDIVIEDEARDFLNGEWLKQVEFKPVSPEQELPF